MKISINTCSSCGRELEIHEIVILNNVNKRILQRMLQRPKPGNKL